LAELRDGHAMGEGHIRILIDALGIPSMEPRAVGAQ